MVIGLVTLYWNIVKYGGEKTRAEAAEQMANNCKMDKDTLEVQIREKNLLISEIMVKVSIDTYDIEDMPYPMGFKIFDPETKLFRMVRVNEPYRKKHGVSNARYFGKKDVDVDDVNGQAWYRNDLKVLKLPEKTPERFYEDSKQGIGSWRKWWVRKNDNQYLYFIEI